MVLARGGSEAGLAYMGIHTIIHALHGEGVLFFAMVGDIGRYI
jgi:hypothetical protein